MHRVKIWMGAVTLVTVLSADPGTLIQMAESLHVKAQDDKEFATAFAMKEGIPVRQEFGDGRVVEIQKIVNGIPRYYITTNANASVTTRTDHLWSGMYSVTGAGYGRLGEWDGGAVRGTHDELTGRVTQMDGASTLSNHSTHVAGTLIGSGVDASAKGMAPEATLLAYDWTDDDSEMATAAANGMEVSNHSYGYITGWHQDSDGDWHWYGDTNVSSSEAYRFGFYDDLAQSWDDIAYHAPYYLIVKAAGNDRNDNAPEAGTEHSHSRNGRYTDTHNDDGYDQGGYDTVSDAAVAKNVLTVGAVDDVANYHSPNDVHMSSFSGWGPTDDGRIKPDIVANGILLHSSVASGDSDYGWYSGTSMASPNAAGTLVLLQEYYQNTHSGASMRSATLKALVIHTADGVGDGVGPDYQFGWGLLNAKSAADKIKEDTTSNVMDELTLSNHQTYERTMTLGSGLSSFKVTIIWTDPAGTPVAPSLDPTDKMLVNDLDLRLTKDGVTYYPWILDRDHPEHNATHVSRNDRDNVEQVYLVNPAEGIYKIIVDHVGALTADQNFSIVIDSAEILPRIEYDSHRIDDDNISSSGNGDGQVDPGESIQLPVTLRNTGNGDAHNVEANLTSEDACVVITDANLSWGDIVAGQTREAADFDFNVSVTCPRDHDIPFHLSMASDEGVWNDDFNVTVALIPNQAPTANAGADQTVNEGEAVTLDGSASTDSDGSIASHAWTEGSTTLSTDSNFAKSDFSVGTHTITLTVIDDDGATDSDTVVVTVTASGSGSAGGGCTYNPKSSGSDFMMVWMMLAAGLYPLMRRNAKQEQG